MCLGQARLIGYLALRAPLKTQEEHDSKTETGSFKKKKKNRKKNGTVTLQVDNM